MWHDMTANESETELISERFMPTWYEPTCTHPSDPAHAWRDVCCKVVQASYIAAVKPTMFHMDSPLFWYVV